MLDLVLAVSLGSPAASRKKLVWFRPPWTPHTLQVDTFILSIVPGQGRVVFSLTS